MGLQDLDPEDYYMSEEGYVVFTEAYHLKRGYCCKNYCKHCPYGLSAKDRAEKKQNRQNPPDVTG